MPRIYMQKESSAISIVPKRTARKGVTAGGGAKFGVKSVSSVSSVEGREQQEQHQNDPGRDDAMLRADWQRFCKTEVPALVMSQMRTVKELELELGEDLVFGGPRGSLKV